MISENVGNLLIFREKVLDLSPKSVCAVEMTMYLTGHININRKDVHARMISINGKYFKNITVYITVLKRMKPQLCFFLKKPSLVIIITLRGQKTGEI